MTKSKYSKYSKYSKQAFRESMERLSESRFKDSLERAIEPTGISYPVRKWGSIFKGAKKFSASSFLFLFSSIYNLRNPVNLADYLEKSEILKELSNFKANELGNIFKTIYQLPYIEKIANGYGLDELALARSALILSSSPELAPEISSALVKVLRVKDNSELPVHVTKLVDVLIDVSASGDTQNITAAKFVSSFIDKLCAENLPKNYQETVEIDNKLNVEKDERERKYLMQERAKLTANYTVLQLLRYNLRDYIGIIRSVNNISFMKGLMSKDSKNIKLLKSLNKEFIAYSLASDTDPKLNEKYNSLISAAVALGINEPSRAECAKLLNKDLIKEIFKLPALQNIQKYEDIAIRLAENSNLKNLHNLFAQILVSNTEVKLLVKNFLEYTGTTPEQKIEKQRSFEAVVNLAVDIAVKPEVIAKAIPLISKDLIDEFILLIDKSNNQVSDHEKQSIIGKAITISNEILKDPRIEQIISKEAQVINNGLVPIINELAKKANENNPVLANQKDLAQGNQFLSNVIKKVNFKELIAEIRINQGTVVPVLDYVLNKETLQKLVPKYSKLLERAEITSKDIIDLMPILENKKTTDALANLLEVPNISNSINLLVTEPKILVLGCKKLFNLCKNSLADNLLINRSDKVIKTETLVEKIAELERAYPNILMDNKKNAEIDLKNMERNVSAVGGDDVVIIDRPLNKQYREKSKRQGK